MKQTGLSVNSQTHSPPSIRFGAIHRPLKMGPCGFLHKKIALRIQKYYLHGEDCLIEKSWAHRTVNSFFFLLFKTNRCLMIFAHSKSKFSLKRWIGRRKNAWLKRLKTAQYLEIWKVSIESIIRKLFGGTIWRFSGIYFVFLPNQFARWNP